MMPTTPADIAVVMNRMTLVRATGTPTARAAWASPPTQYIQLPNVVRLSTHVATTVMAIHQSTAVWKLYGAKKVLPKIACALANPGAWSDTSNRTVLVRRSVTPTFTPLRTKNVASVMMKLGSLVRTTSIPLIAPISAAKARKTTIPAQTLTW